MPGPKAGAPTTGASGAGRRGRRGRPAQRSRRGLRTPASEAPAWPGHLPSPSPTSVFAEPVPAEVVDADGRPVTVTGRQGLTAAPARLSVDGGRWDDIVGWAGPWPVDERWWDASAWTRRARFQVLTSQGLAYLLTLEKGTWRVEAGYD